MSLGYNSFFIMNDETVKGCGCNLNGRLGTGDTSYRYSPILLSKLENIKQIFTGDSYSIFLLNDGTVKVCGSNTYGQLGLGDTTNRNVPTSIDNLSNVLEINDYITLFNILYTILSNSEEFIVDEYGGKNLLLNTEAVINKGYSDLSSLLDGVNSISDLLNYIVKKYKILNE